VRTAIIFHSRAAAEDAFVIERIRQAEAIFLAGGDQWNYYRYWHDTPVAREVNAAIARGVPVGGTSAGLAVLGQYGFTAEHDSVTSAVALADPFHLKVSVTADLFRIPALACTITDSHFTQRDRLGRLVVFMARIHAERRCAQVQGVGIDERTVLLLEPDGRGRVVGAGAVHWLRLQAAEIKKGQPAHVARVEAVSLPAGRTLDLKGTLPPGGYELSIASGRLLRRPEIQ
jgi:cyanophycinase